MSYKDITLNVSKTIKVSPSTWDGEPKEMKGKRMQNWFGMGHKTSILCHASYSH
jgi:hypothetical protein